MKKDETKKIPRNREDNLRPQKAGEPSHNPNGRPKGSKNRSTLFKKWLETTTKSKNPISGEDEEMTVEDKMVLKVIGNVLTKGDIQSFKEAMDSMYGKHQEHIDHTSKDKPIQSIPMLVVPQNLSVDEWTKKYSQSQQDDKSKP